MRSILSIATIAGAALLVSACGGSAANNSANAVVDNGTMMGNADVMAPDMNAPMPADNSAMGNSAMGNSGSMGNSSMSSNTTAMNTTNAM